MSATTEQLRHRLTAELDELGPIPDLVPAAARAGAQTLRRRRLAVGSALGVAALGGSAFAATQGGSEPGEPVAVDPASPSVSAPPPVDPMADGKVTTAEYEESVRRTLEETLPARYGAVSIAPEERNRAQMYSTGGGDPRLQFFASVYGRGSEHESWTCAAQSAARPLISCAEAQLDDGWLAVATFERSGGSDDGGNPAYGTALLFVNDDVYFQMQASELGWDGLALNGPAGLSPEEIVGLASTPEFLEMVRVAVEWRLDQPEPRYPIADMPDPVWPTP